MVSMDISLNFIPPPGKNPGYAPVKDVFRGYVEDVQTFDGHPDIRRTS